MRWTRTRGTAFQAVVDIDCTFPHAPAGSRAHGKPSTTRAHLSTVIDGPSTRFVEPSAVLAKPSTVLVGPSTRFAKLSTRLAKLSTRFAKLSSRLAKLSSRLVELSTVVEERPITPRSGRICRVRASHDRREPTLGRRASFPSVFHTAVSPPRPLRLHCGLRVLPLGGPPGRERSRLPRLRTPDSPPRLLSSPKQQQPRASSQYVPPGSCRARNHQSLDLEPPLLWTHSWNRHSAS
ncbi:hypothetical protein MNBD_PLANCTO03-204 [hydrothermal vent metagenome]|uniref:Uncharacterized protein n=1 Tax=hydrothermal vent metagenome TaxID=652676 RepID=A0A3B1D9Z3_9ZZZZ